MGKGSFSGNPKTEWLCEHGDDRNMCLLETRCWPPICSPPATMSRRSAPPSPAISGPPDPELRVGKDGRGKAYCGSQPDPEPVC